MVGALLLAVSLSAARTTGAGHPLHTTMAEVTVDRAHSTVRVVVRVFADDFGTAMNGARRTGSWDARAAAYVGSAIELVDDKKQRSDLRDCGSRRQGDLLWLCAEASVSAGQLAHLSVRDQMLCELFPDQVNVVRVTDGASTRSMLFTRGDAPKPILG